MAKGAYIGVNNVARKIKKGYIGVGGVARKIKKAYIGVGGVARPFWSGGEFVYYGSVSSLSEAKSSCDNAGTTIGNYAIIAGGQLNDGYPTYTVEVYSTSLVRSTADMLSRSRIGIAAQTIGNYAICATGTQYSDPTNAVDFYDKSLVHTKSTLPMNTGNPQGAATKTHAIFYAVQDSGGHGLVHCVFAYDASLTLTRTNINFAYNDSSGLTYDHMHSASVGDYSLFAGINMAGTASVTYAYNSSLVLTKPTIMPDARSYIRGASTSNHALFAGGSQYDAGDATYAYNSSLTLSSITGLYAKSTSMASTSLDGNAIFAGGNAVKEGYQYTVLSTDVIIYDASLVRLEKLQLNTAKYNMTAVTVGNYAIFAAGRGSYLTDTAEAIALV